jgi:hypothetical protein
MDRTAELKAKIERLRRKKAALLTQSRLIQDFVSLAKSAAKSSNLASEHGWHSLSEYDRRSPIHLR